MLQQALSSPLIELVGAITIVGLLTYARDQIKAGALTAEDFASFIIALVMLLEPVKRLVGIHNIFEQAIGASQKVFEYLDQHGVHRREAERREARRIPRGHRLRPRQLPLSRRARRLRHPVAVAWK